MFTNDDNGVTVSAIDKEAPTFVNGQQISSSVSLQHVSSLCLYPVVLVAYVYIL